MHSTFVCVTNVFVFILLLHVANIWNTPTELNFLRQVFCKEDFGEEIVLKMLNQFFLCCWLSRQKNSNLWYLTCQGGGGVAIMILDCQAPGNFS